MKKISKILIIAASLSLVIGFLFPLWEISLEAPQYPEGLSMQIWVNKITGDLNTINGLNHYIGMKKIQPDSIKELTLMPFILAFIAATGVIVGFAGKKKLFVWWVGLFILIGAAGAVDFYVWEYDYGHNLNTEAAIKVPGMSYQPPIIGSKQLLNFVATSLPDTGGIALIGAGLLSLLVLFYESRYNKLPKAIKNEEEHVEHDIAHSVVNSAILRH
jgi:copper chaperone NosL